MTHMCVEATARASIDLGFKATVIASATATRPLPDPLGGASLTADEVQRNALAAIADRFATVAKKWMRCRTRGPNFRSPDEAQRNPGAIAPHSASLHAG